MADEITVNLRVQLANSSLPDDFNPGRIQVDQSAVELFKRVVAVGTSEESLTFTDVTTPGLCYLYNLDSTNYVQYGNATGSYIGRLKPSSFPNLLELDGGATTLYLKANTASCQVLVCVYGV